MNIKDQIKNIKLELDNPGINRQRNRYLKDELDSLERYLNQYPDREECPNQFELFCYLNPEAPECRVYDL